MWCYSFFLSFFISAFLFCLPRLWPPRAPPPPNPHLLLLDTPPRVLGPQRPPLEEGGEGELMVCLPDVSVDPTLYTPQLLFLQRPLEAPVSPAWLSPP